MSQVRVIDFYARVRSETRLTAPMKPQHNGAVIRQVSDGACTMVIWPDSGDSSQRAHYLEPYSTSLVIFQMSSVQKFQHHSLTLPTMRLQTLQTRSESRPLPSLSLPEE
jgi:hypothetical protein